MMRQTILLTLSALLFVTLCGAGLIIAAHKPLWLDELHTQFLSVQNRPAWQIITSGGADEGNSAPLYYLIQKWINLVPGEQVSADVLKDAIWAEPKAQLILRGTAILCMSMAICIIFYYFASRFSLWAGFYALTCTLASPMIWLYWAEARPYPLVLLLTTIQLILLLEIWRKQHPDKANISWGWLALVHILLVSTSYLSLIQVTAAAIVVFLNNKYSKRQAGLLLGIPCLIALFYRSVAPKLNYALNFQWSYLLDNIPMDRIIFLALTAALWFLYQPDLNDQRNPHSWTKIIKPYLGFLSITLVGIALLFLAVRMHPNQTPEGLHSRFFIFLTPAGIVLQVMLAIAMFRRLSGHTRLLIGWLVANLLLGALAFMNTSMQVLRDLRYL